MDKTNLENYFLNGQPLEEVTASALWGLIGLLLSVLIEIIRGSQSIKIKGGFRFGTYLENNIVRIVASIIIVVIGSVFGRMITGEIPVWACCLIGFVTDKVIEALIKFKPNIDISKILTIFVKKNE